MSKVAIILPPSVEAIEDELASFAKANNGEKLTSTSRDEFRKDCSADGKYSDISIIYLHPSFFKVTGPFDAEMFDEILPRSLKAICYNGAGYDKIDVQAALRKNVQVSHTPSAVDAATATTAMYLIIAALRGFSEGEHLARQNAFDKGFKLHRDPEGKVLGIIGMGGIGRALAKRALAFDMRIIYHNRNELEQKILKEADLDGKVKYVSSMEDLIKQSDVVSLNMPLNPQTKGMFNDDMFALMRDSAVLVNTSRGGTVDEAALIRALETKKIYSAGLDVFASEPQIPTELQQNRSITILPHLGTASIDSRRKMEMLVLDNVKSFLASGRLVTPVPEHKGKF